MNSYPSADIMSESVVKTNKFVNCFKMMGQAEEQYCNKFYYLIASSKLGRIIQSGNKQERDVVHSLQVICSLHICCQQHC